MVNGLAALVLAGILAYLYLKTEAVDYARHEQAMAALLRLKDIDSRWTRDVLQIRLNPAQAGQADALARLAEEALQQLAEATAGIADPELGPTLKSLRQEVAAKAQLLARLHAPGVGVEADRG
ncbi:MAG TPA: hypothetical protein VF104_11695, partial [Burkholderiales bacterium]